MRGNFVVFLEKSYDQRKLARYDKAKNKGESEEIRNDTREEHGQKKIVDTNEEIQMDICSLFPMLVLLIIFSYMPLLGVQIAFRDYRYAKGIWGKRLVGFKYFERMFREATFLRVLRNTLWISFLKIVIVFPGGVIFRAAAE